MKVKGKSPSPCKAYQEGTGSRTAEAHRRLTGWLVETAAGNTSEVANLMDKANFEKLDPKDQSAVILEMCDEANRKCAEWEDKTFDLGSAAKHCAKLESFADPLLLELTREGTAVISMPSEYYAPRFDLKAMEGK